MFRSRFNDAMPSKLPHFGPQDVERGVMEEPPSQQMEQLLCALLGLVLNRKKPVEYVHTAPRPRFRLAPRGWWSEYRELRGNWLTETTVKQARTSWSRTRRSSPEPEVAMAAQMERAESVARRKEFREHDASRESISTCTIHH